jgi:hypothetical protein
VLLKLVSRHFTQKARVVGDGVDQSSDSLSQGRRYRWWIGSVLPAAGCTCPIMSMGSRWHPRKKTSGIITCQHTIFITLRNCNNYTYSVLQLNLLIYFIGVHYLNYTTLILFVLSCSAACLKRPFICKIHGRRGSKKVNPPIRSSICCFRWSSSHCCHFWWHVRVQPIIQYVHFFM